MLGAPCSSRDVTAISAAMVLGGIRLTCPRQDI